MRNTVFCLIEDGDPKAIEASVEQMADDVRAYVPGFRLKQAVQFEEITKARPVRIDGVGDVYPRPKGLGLPRGRGRRTLPAEIRRQSRHHDVGRAAYGRAPGHGHPWSPEGRSHERRPTLHPGRHAARRHARRPASVFRRPTSRGSPRRSTAPASTRLRSPTATGSPAPASPTDSARTATSSGSRRSSAA